MAGFYQTLQVNRPAEPDPAVLLTTLRSGDSTIGYSHIPGTNVYVLKKNSAWTAPQITAATNAITNAPNLTSQSVAQNEIDRFPIAMRALVLALIDEINILRAQHSLPARTPAQAIQAIRNKAATL